MKLRVGTAADIDFVLAVEADPVVGRWIDAAPRARHSQVVDDPDLTHLIAVARGRDVGFLLMAGLTNPHASIELRRIAMAERGAGHGSAALAAVADWAFGERGAHRLWLDAHVDNAVARGAYRRAGFSEEGVMRDALRVGDGWASLVLMSQLRDEWAERSRPAT